MKSRHSYLLVGTYFWQSILPLRPLSLLLAVRLAASHFEGNPLLHEIDLI